MNKHTLFIIRGLPGSGKSTLGKKIAPRSVAADDFFDRYHKGVFKPELLKNAHSWCKDYVEGLMQLNNNDVAVCNTFTQEWEFQPYIELAKNYDYNVVVMVVENYHGNKSIHNVPEETIEKMRNRFKINL